MNDGGISIRSRENMENNPTLTRRAIDEVCRKAADLMLGYPWKLWFWADSIGMEGLLAASAITGDAKYFGYVYGFLKAWIPRFEHHSRFDHTAAGTALIDCYLRTGDAHLLGAAEDFAAYLDSFRRTASGCPMHYEDAHFELPPELPPDHPQYDPEQESRRRMLDAADGGPCVFVDSIHFQAPFLASLYAVTGDARYLEQAEATIGPQVELLWDEQEHLFHHFWIERTGRRNGVLWGRGNGWAMLGVLHTLSHLPEDRPLAGHLRNVIARQAARLAELQDGSGDWRTVLTDPESYLESSIAAFVVDGFGLAIECGWISPDYQDVVERAWRAMWRNVREDGLFEGVSFETFPSTRAEHYRQMPRGALVPWGQGPFLTACHRYLKIEHIRKTK